MGIHDSMYAAGYYRPREGRVIAGVCAGLGRRWGLTPWAMRWLFILCLMVIPGSQILVYPLLWILMPDERQTAWVEPQASTQPTA